MHILDENALGFSYDQLGRLVKMRHIKGTDLLAGFEYAYNRENMHTSKNDLAHPSLSEVYRYDSVYRLANFDRGTLTATKDAITGTPIATQAWLLDGVGNWATTTLDGQTQTQTVNNMNEYETFGAKAQSHSPNGNLLDDSRFQYIYDFANRITEVRSKDDQTMVAQYSYDAFNRRIAKTLTQTQDDPNASGEYQTDGNTLALYHFNATSGPVLDSSGHANHGRASHHSERGVEGLWDTKAIEFKGAPVIVPSSPSLNDLGEQLTLETWVYLEAPECNHHQHKSRWVKYFKHHHKCKIHGRKSKCTCKPTPCHFCPLCWLGQFVNGSLLSKPGSYELELNRNRRAVFTLYTEQAQHRRLVPVKTTLQGTTQIPLDQWVHIAATYDGAMLRLYINGDPQSATKPATGTIKRLPTPLLIGSDGFRGTLEEARISNIARTSFGGNGGGTITTLTKRAIYYNGWQKIEERETVTTGNQTTLEKITRQFVDGANIDEHICVDYYNDSGTAIEKTYYFHQNYRGDTVAVTDATGEIVVKLAYSAYGEVYEIAEDGTLQEYGEVDAIGYFFQGRELDAETGNYYFRARYYSAEQGRFLSRDPLGYVDGLGLYEAFRGSPYKYWDFSGKETGEIPIYFNGQKLGTLRFDVYPDPISGQAQFVGNFEFFTEKSPDDKQLLKTLKDIHFLQIVVEGNDVLVPIDPTNCNQALTYPKLSQASDEDLKNIYGVKKLICPYVDPPEGGFYTEQGLNKTDRKPFVYNLAPISDDDGWIDRAYTTRYGLQYKYSFEDPIDISYRKKMKFWLALTKVVDKKIHILGIVEWQGELNSNGEVEVKARQLSIAPDIVKTFDTAMQNTFPGSEWKVQD